MKKMGLVALMALLCLPMGALAVREGVIEDAPMVEARRKTSYLPMHRVVVEETGWMLEEAYTEVDTTQMMHDEIRASLTSNCRLTTGERKRMEKLMAAYAAGERTGDGASVLEAKKNVRVGVYALDPAEYDGERVLLLLPGNCLTDEEMQKQYLNTIVKKAESLTDMINTFHDYSKLEHPEFCLVRETQDLAEYLREYLAEKYDEIDLGGFNLEVEIPEETVSYSFDRVQMKRVFDNIISNSLRHNPPGTVIYVTLQQSDKAVRIEIGDSGVGIPLELQDTLFDPFIVGDESRNTRQGSGLGLAVAHKIIELHGGALFLEKGEQHGNGISTLFVIRLLK